MLLSILGGAPLWVRPVPVFLVWIGLKSTRERSVPVWLLLVLPLAGCLSVNAVYGLGAGGSAWLAFVAFYALGAFGGYGTQNRLIIFKGEGQVTLRGEWLTFVAFMLVFWMNFAGGVAKAISPQIYSSLGFAIIFASIAGIVSGSFFGRAVAVWRT